MSIETSSVIDFLEGSNILKDYFGSCIAKGNEVSYSGFLIEMKLSGTTAEGVDFQSSKISRSAVTVYMRKKFKSFCNGDM